MLENEAKCNNATFGTKTFTIKYVFYSISVIFWKTQIHYETSQILYEPQLCVTDSLLQKLQILYDICSRFFMKQM